MDPTFCISIQSSIFVHAFPGKIFVLPMINTDVFLLFYFVLFHFYLCCIRELQFSKWLPKSTPFDDIHIEVTWVILHPVKD